MESTRGVVFIYYNFRQQINNMGYEDEQFQQNEEYAQKIVIGLVAWRGRKHLTQVKNIPHVFDLERIFKYWRKKLKCGGSIEEEQSTKNKEKQEKRYYLQLHGDHRDWVQQFLIYMGITTKQNIRKQGKVNN